jgi:hypothetical protein
MLPPAYRMLSACLGHVGGNVAGRRVSADGSRGWKERRGNYCAVTCWLATEALTFGVEEGYQRLSAQRRTARSAGPDRCYHLRSR